MNKPSPAVRLLTILLVLIFFSCAFASTGNKNKKVLLWRVNINTASSAELQRVPGIGPKTAERILAMRRSVGKFHSVDDLLAVRGLGEKRLAKMKPYLTVGTPPPAAAPPRGVAPSQGAVPPAYAGKKPAPAASNSPVKSPGAAANKP